MRTEDRRATTPKAVNRRQRGTASKSEGGFSPDVPVTTAGIRGKPTRSGPRGSTLTAAKHRGLWRIIIGAVAPALVGFFLYEMALERDPFSHPKTSGSQMLQAGSVVAAVDQEEPARDYELEFLKQPGDQVDMLVWDYAAEDGDWVQIRRVGGVPLSEPFMILHQPRRVSVPVGALVTVVGVRDGGGGITYAVNFPDIHTSIRNGTSADKGNTYTLKATGR